MIGKTYIGDLKIRSLQFMAMEDEIYLPAGRMAGMGRDARGIGVLQSGCSQKQFKLPASPEGIEIPGDDYRFSHVFNQTVETLQLILAVPVFQGQMNDEEDDLFQLHLDDQALYSLVEIMERMAKDVFFAEQGIRLHFQDRDPASQRIVRIFGFDDESISQPLGDHFRLAAFTGSVRA